MPSFSFPYLPFYHKIFLPTKVSGQVMESLLLGQLAYSIADVLTFHIAVIDSFFKIVHTSFYVPGGSR